MTDNTTRSQSSRGSKASTSAQPISGTSSDNPLISVKHKYALELKSLKELFYPEWDEDSLIMALQEVEFDIDAAIERISQGHAGMWHEVKKEHTKEKSSSPAPTPHSAGQVTGTNGTIKANGETVAAPGRGGLAPRGGFRGARGGGVAGRGGRGGGRGGRGGFSGSSRGKPSPSPDVSLDGGPTDSNADGALSGAVWGDAPPQDEQPSEITGGWGDDTSPSAEKSAEAQSKVNGRGEPTEITSSAPSSSATQKPVEKRASPSKSRPANLPTAAPAHAPTSTPPVTSAAQQSKAKPTSWAAVVKPAPPPEPKVVPQNSANKVQEQVAPKPVSKVITPPPKPSDVVSSLPVQASAEFPAPARESTEAKRLPPGLKQPAPPTSVMLKPANPATAPSPQPAIVPQGATASQPRKALKQDVAVVMPVPDLAEKLASVGVGVKFGTVDSQEAPRKPAVQPQVVGPNVAVAPATSPQVAPSIPQKSAPTPPPSAPAQQSRTASPQRAPIQELAQSPGLPLAITEQLAIVDSSESEPVEVPSLEGGAPLDVTPSAPEESSTQAPAPQPPSQPVAAITAPTPISQLLAATSTPSQPQSNAAPVAATQPGVGANATQRQQGQSGVAAPQLWGENPAAAASGLQQSALPSWQAFQGMGWGGDYAAIYGGLGQQGVEAGRGLMGYYDPQSVYNAQASAGAGFGQATSASNVGQPLTGRESSKFPTQGEGQGTVQQQQLPTSSASTTVSPQQAPSAATPAAQTGYPNMGLPYAYYPYGYPMGQFAAAPQYAQRNMYPAMYQLPQQSSAQGSGPSGGNSPAPGHNLLPQQQQVPQHGLSKTPQQASSQYGYGGSLFPYAAQEAQAGGMGGHTVSQLSEYGKTVYGMGVPGFGFSTNLQDGGMPIGAKQVGVGPSNLGGLAAQGYGKQSYDSHKAAASGYQLPSGASQASQQQNMNQAYFAAGAGQFGPQGYPSYGHHQSGGYGGRGSQGYWGQS